MLNSETKNIFELGTAIISAVNTVFETIKNILPKTKDTTLNKELMRLQEIIISLFTLFHTYQLKTNETLDKTRHLEREIERLKNWNKEISHYKLREIGHEVYAYEKIKPSKKRNTTPHHYLCAKCVNDQKKSILQLLTQTSVCKTYLCHECKSEYLVFKKKR